MPASGNHKPKLTADAAYENAHLVAQDLWNASASCSSKCRRRATKSIRSIGATSAT
jgi:hypothetical protein